jgi:hypothetical protein
MTKTERFLVHIARTRAKKVREPRPKNVMTRRSRRFVPSGKNAALFAAAIAAGMTPSQRRSKPA